MSGSEKFNTCAHKTAEPLTEKVRICCNNYKDVNGYGCLKRKIFPLDEKHCAECQEYEGQQK